MLRARVPGAREPGRLRPEDPRVEAPERRRVEVAEAVEVQRLRPQLEPKS